MIFDVVDLQDSRQCWGYRMLLTLLDYGVLLILLDYGVLLILLVINLCGGCKPNKALVGVSS